MKFTTTRETLLKPLQLVLGVVERRQTLPILSNVLLKATDDSLTITATDQEVEIVATVDTPIDEPGETTLPARKLLDICKTSLEGAHLIFSIENDKARIRSERSRFSLSTLPAEDFPETRQFDVNASFKIPQSELKQLIDRTQFSMAQQDVRKYLNGMLIEVRDKMVISVATDGHRLSYCKLDTTNISDKPCQIIIPRKGVQELSRLLEDTDSEISVQIGDNHISAEFDHLKFTSKLIEGKFPDYERLLPNKTEINLTADRETLRQALVRTSILSNEKYRGIRFTLSSNKLSIQANNPEQEKAEEEIEVDYSGNKIEIGFNVNYLLDALSAIDEDKVQILMVDQNSSCLLQQPGSADCKYIIMPMRL